MNHSDRRANEVREEPTQGSTRGKTNPALPDFLVGGAEERLKRVSGDLTHIRKNSQQFDRLEQLDRLVWKFWVTHQRRFIFNSLLDPFQFTFTLRLKFGFAELVRLRQPHVYRVRFVR